MALLNPNCSEVIFRLFTGDKKLDSMEYGPEGEDIPIIMVSDGSLMDAFKEAYSEFKKLKRKNPTLKGVSFDFVENTGYHGDEDVIDSVIQLALNSVKTPNKKKSAIKTIKEWDKEIDDENGDAD